MMVKIEEHTHELINFNIAQIRMCALRRKYAHLFSQFAGDFSVERPYLKQPVDAQAVSDFLLQYDNRLFYFVSELMDLLLTSKDQ